MGYVIAILGALVAILLGAGKLISTQKLKKMELQLDLQTRKVQEVTGKLAQAEADIQSSQSREEAQAVVDAIDAAVDASRADIQSVADKTARVTQEAQYSATIRFAEAVDKAVQAKEDIKDEGNDEPKLSEPVAEIAAESMEGFLARRGRT